MTLIPPVRKGDLRYTPNHYHTSDQVSNETELPGDTLTDVLNDQGWITKKFSFTSAQILTLFSNPRMLLPAPGVNKAYQLQSNNFARLNFGGIAYATNLTLAMVYDTVNKQAVGANGFILQVPQTKLTNFLLASPSSSTSQQQIVTNTPLYLTVQTGNPTAGNGTLDIWITYRIIDLS